MYIELSQYYYDKCAEFADRQLETSKDCYRRRGERRIDVIRHNLITGKLGEIAAYKYMVNHGYKVSKPDFTIYERRNKSFDADLSTDCGINVHVKSQGYDSLMRYGASWLLQKSDKLVKTGGEKEFILMVSMKGLQADVLGVVSVDDLHEHELFEEPKVSRYAHTKKAIYFDSIKQSGISLEAI
mgnify:CR=1 FL=1